MGRRCWEEDFSQDPLCVAGVGRSGLSWGLGVKFLRVDGVFVRCGIIAFGLRCACGRILPL